MAVDFTGGSVIVAEPLGSFSLAGVQMKVSARSEPEMQLTCEACGWHVLGYVRYDGGDPYLIEWPQGQTPETENGRSNEPQTQQPGA
jgi:hypothetical protein